jgi:hypothetical protein
VAVTPLAFSPSPLHPPEGEYPTTAPQNKERRRRARAFLCSSPVTPPAFSFCRAQARASLAISAAPLSGSVFKGVPEGLDAILKGSANIWFTEERNLEVTVLIDAQVSHYFKRRTIFPIHKIMEERPDGSLVVSFRMGQYEAIRNIKSWIPNIVILELEEFSKDLLADMKGWVRQKEKE